MLTAKNLAKRYSVKIVRSSVLPSPWKAYFGPATVVASAYDLPALRTQLATWWATYLANGATVRVN